MLRSSQRIIVDPASRESANQACSRLFIRGQAVIDCRVGPAAGKPRRPTIDCPRKMVGRRSLRELVPPYEYENDSFGENSDDATVVSGVTVPEGMP